MAMRQAGGSRLLRAGYAGISTTLRSFARVAHLLWLQITGVFFCFFALIFAVRLPKAYASHTAGTSPRYHLVLLASLTVMFAWFGVSSFWRARKK
jgi:hypothetical protein